MTIYGTTCDPFEVFNWLQTNNIKFSFDRPRFCIKTVVFSSLKQMTACARYLGNRCVIVFDVEQRLESVQGISILQSVDDLFQVRNGGNTVKDIRFTKMNTINDVIEQNKDTGLMHLYNTSLYGIKVKNLREQIKQIVYDYIRGDASREKIASEFDALIDMRRNTSTKEVLNKMKDLIMCSDFDRVKVCVGGLLKHKHPVPRELIETQAAKYQSTAYDVNYFYAVLTQQRKT